MKLACTIMMVRLSIKNGLVGTGEMERGDQPIIIRCITLCRGVGKKHYTTL